jgi:uncharacterized membrane protein YedE/YeeE
VQEPTRFAELPPPVRLQLAIFTPFLFGALAGLVVVHGSTVYWIMQAIAGLGGLAAGTEHNGAREGAIRVAIGGLLFGLGIFIAFEATGDEAKIGTEPDVVLIVFTTVAGAILGAIGGALGARARARASTGTGG